MLGLREYFHHFTPVWWRFCYSSHGFTAQMPHQVFFGHFAHTEFIQHVWPLLTQAMVLGIWGSLVVWCRLWRVLGWSSLTEVRTLALPAIVFILEEFREEEELGVRSVPEGLSEFS